MKALTEIYERLHSAFGPQHWWPADSPFEVAVGAVLTQNTNWTNVERAIKNLKKDRALSARVLGAMQERRLARLIRPAGYYNVKARRLKSFVRFLGENYGGSMKKMARLETDVLRGELLGINGVGPETADSILLYALQKPVFVIDAYTKRILSRHGVIDHDAPYGDFQDLFHGHFSSNGSSPERLVSFFNEYHALFVRAAKEHCRKSNPQCGGCPLEDL